MKLRLKKDIVIPAGTVFDDASIQTTRAPGEFAETIVGLSKDTFGSFTYSVGQKNSEERKQVAEYFEEI